MYILQKMIICKLNFDKEYQIDISKANNKRGRKNKLPNNHEK